VLVEIFFAYPALISGGTFGEAHRFFLIVILLLYTFGKFCQVLDCG